MNGQRPVKPTSVVGGDAGLAISKEVWVHLNFGTSTKALMEFVASPSLGPSMPLIIIRYGVPEVILVVPLPELNLVITIGEVTEVGESVRVNHVVPPSVEYL